MVNRAKMVARATLYSKDFGRDSSGNIVTKVKKKALDFFKVQLPDNIYKEYMQRRRETERKLLEELRKTLSTLNEEKGVD